MLASIGAAHSNAFRNAMTGAIAGAGIAALGAFGKAMYSWNFDRLPKSSSPKEDNQYRYPKTLEQRRKDYKMKSYNFMVIAGCLTMLVFTAMICSTIIVCKAIDPYPEVDGGEVEIRLMQGVNDQDDLEEIAEQRRDFIVAKLTSLGFEYDSYDNTLTIKGDQHYYESIKPEVDKVMDQYASDIDLK